MWTLPFLLACKRVAFDLDVDLFPGGDEPAAFPEASPFELALFDERPEATVPAFLDLEELGPVLVADRLLRADDDGFLQVEVTSLALDLDAPVDLTFEVSSGTARWLVLGGEGGGEVPSCSVRLAPDAQPAALASALTDCLRDTTDAHGGPDDFAMSVVAATADDDWAVTMELSFGTDRPVDVLCTGALAVDDALREQAGTTEIVIEELGLAGYAAAQDEGAAVVAFANVWADDGAPAVAGASGGVRVAAGEGRFVGERVEPAASVPASITFGGAVGAVDVWPADWAATAMDTLLADGFLETCDVRVHDAAPNRTFVELALVGSGEAVR
jgi:hypothetical protein